MKWYINMKIGMKLILGFLIVALIAGGIGVVGYIGITRVEGYLNTTAKVKLPRVDAMLVIAEAQTAVRAGQRNLVNPDRSAEQSAAEYQYIEDAFKRSSDARAIYDTLPRDADEEQQWVLFLPLWDEWVSRVETNIEASKAYEEARSNNANNVEQLREQLIVVTNLSAEAYVPAKASLDKVVEVTRASVIIASTEATAGIKSSIALLIGFAAIGIVLSIVLGVWISNIIKKPINMMVEASKRMADGDLDVQINVNSKDEIGVLALAFSQMANNMNEVMTNINSASEQVASGSRQVSDSSMSLSQGATEQASSIEELTASIEEISSQTRLNATNANQANVLAESAKLNAEQGNAQMQMMLKSMDEINDSSNSISKIIKVIDEIAFQTNILALNAAVEAARAGQHGKGFAVVAEEVRNLAARSANAAKETTAMIEGSIKKVEGGTKIANETATALIEIVKSIEKVSNLVSDIAVASNEQAIGVDQINQGVGQIANVVQTTSATSEETAAASEELSSQAEMLKHQVARFKLRRISHNNYGGGMDDVNPEVLKMLDNLRNQNKFGQNEGSTPQKETPKIKKLTLSEKDFGKY